MQQLPFAVSITFFVIITQTKIICTIFFKFHILLCDIKSKHKEATKMDLQKMLSKFSPEQLEQGMKQLNLTPDQMNAVKGVANGADPNKAAGNFDQNEINSFLKNNPEMAKQLKQANMMSMISDIFKK